MDDGEIELSDHVYIPNSSTNNDAVQIASTTVDSILDEILKHTKTCTHTHTCNPPGPDATHTHTCYHTHTQVFSSEDDTKSHCSTPSLKPRKPVGNREAVRKYREKKKAHTAFLEEEVKKLRLVNQHLVRRLQGQAALEAELMRLRALFVNLRGKIDVELGSFPFLKHCNAKSFDCGSHPSDGKANGLNCPAEMPCFSQSFSNGGGSGTDKPVFSWQENCQPVIVDCHETGYDAVVGSSSRRFEVVDCHETGIDAGDRRFEVVRSFSSAKNQVQ